MQLRVRLRLRLGRILGVGGGFGNIYDRLVYGSVTDFLQMNFVIVRTGIFNMADVSIMAGMFMILLEAYLKQTKFNHKTLFKDCYVTIPIEANSLEIKVRGK